jgi:hypothetical protein
VAGPLGVRFLDWVIPFYVTALQGRPYRTPGGGVCAECEKRRARVFVRGDGTPYCAECITFDLATADPSDEMKREQPHPDEPRVGIPYEIRYDIIKYVVADDADLRTYEQAFE